MLLDFLSHSSCLLLSILNSLNSLLIWLRLSSHNILFCLVHSTATFSFLFSSWVGRFCNSALISDWVLSISCINYILKSWAIIFLCVTQAFILNFFFFLTFMEPFLCVFFKVIEIFDRLYAYFWNFVSSDSLSSHSIGL